MMRVTWHSRSPVMARKASVRYWPGRKGGGYFCVYQGVRRELALGPDDAPDGPTYLSALEAFQALMRGETAKAVAAREAAQVTVREVLDEYLKHISKSKKP